MTVETYYDFLNSGSIYLQRYWRKHPNLEEILRPVAVDFDDGQCITIEKRMARYSDEQRKFLLEVFEADVDDLNDEMERDTDSGALNLLYYIGAIMQAIEWVNKQAEKNKTIPQSNTQRALDVPNTVEVKRSDSPALMGH